MSLGMSEFARKQHRPGSGNSYTTLSEDELIKLVRLHWGSARPGQGETWLDRKILVSVPPTDFFLPFTPLRLGMPLSAEVTQRQEGEDLYVETFLSTSDAAAFGASSIAAVHVDIVCYSAAALLENGGTRSTDCDWEIVAILAKTTLDEPMRPLTMARNFLELPGGTKSEYTAREFAEAILYWSQSKGVKIKDV